MDERDAEVVKHIARHWISLRVVIEKLFFEGGNSGNVLQRLRDEKVIASKKGLGGQVSYYQLTPAGAASLGLPASRARALSPQALELHLGVLWFCSMGKRKRHKLDAAAMKKLFRGGSPSGPHCLEESAKPRVFRVYRPGSDAKAASVIRQARKHVDDARAKPVLRRWVELRQYAFAILAETEPRRLAIERAVRSECGGDELPILSSAHVVVETVPGLRTLKEALRDPDRSGTK